jgi:phage baseplate assembly protein W
MGDLYGESIDTRSATLAPLTDDQQILAQWVALCLETPRGTCWSAPEYGFDLRAYALRPLTTDDLAVLPLELKHALTFDERIADADATLVSTFTGGGAVLLKFTITITPKDATAAPFTLTGTASAETVSIALRGL